MQGLKFLIFCLLTIVGSIIYELVKKRRAEAELTIRKTSHAEDWWAVSQRRMAEARARAERDVALERQAMATEEKSRRSTLAQTRLGDVDAYRSLGSRKFEDAIANIFRSAGYQVYQTAYSRDGGKDAILWKDNRKHVLECKCYSDSGLTGRRDFRSCLRQCVRQRHTVRSL